MKGSEGERDGGGIIVETRLSFLEYNTLGRVEGGGEKQRKKEKKSRN